MKSANAWIVIAVIAGASYCRSLAYAQPVTDPIAVESDDKPWNRGTALVDRQAARDLFLQGNRLFKIPLITQAIDQYTAALAKLQHPAIYFNLALAQLSLGLEAEARDSLEHALRYGEEPLGPKQFHEAQAQLLDLERKLGQIRVACQTDGAEITLDGVSLFTGPGSHDAWVKARSHEITAKKPDYLSVARRVTVSPGERRSLELKLITLSEAAESGRRWATWKPWAVIAVGAAVVAGGGIVNELAARNFNDFDARFSNLPCAAMPPHACAKSEVPAELSSQLNRANREQQIAVAGYIAGGGLIAAGAVLLYLNRPRVLEQSATSSPVDRVAVVPTISAGALGVLVTVSH